MIVRVPLSEEPKKKKRLQWTLVVAAAIEQNLKEKKGNYI